MNLILQEIFITKGRKKLYDQVRDTLKNVCGAYLNDQIIKEKQKKLLTEKTDFLVL